MVALNFPASPNTNDNYTLNGKTFRFNGTAWIPLSSTFINNGSYVFYDGTLNVGIGTNTPSQKLEVNGTILANGIMVGTDTVWHTGNDGDNSGLDADLLDGVDSDQFLRSDIDDTYGAGSTARTLTIGPNSILDVEGNLYINGSAIDADDIAETLTRQWFTNNRVDNRIALASVGDLNDVDLTTAPTNGQTLIWNAINNEFEPGEPGSTLTTQEEGTTVIDDTQTINFVGNGVTLTNVGGVATVTVSGAGISSSDNVAEGSTNFYFTGERVDDRVNALLRAGSNLTLTYNDNANTLTIGLSGVLTDLSGQTTDNLTEGTNVSRRYFTDERVDDRVNALLTEGTGISLTYDDGAGTLEISSNATTNIGGLTDVTLTNPVDASLLVYDSGTQTWRDQILSGDISMSDSGVVTINSNSVALGTNTTGIYISNITGTTNEIEVSGSGSESALVTIGLPNNITVSNNLTVQGNLIVNGVTTTVNSTTVTIDDPIFTLGGDIAPTSNDGDDRGIEFRYFDTQARLGFFGWDRSTNRFIALRNAINSSETFSGTSMDAQFERVYADLTGDVTGNLTGDVTGNLTGDVTGNLTGDVTGDVTGNADSASTLETARTISLIGSVVGSASFDGSANVSITTTISGLTVDLNDVADDTFTFAKLQNISTNRILGRTTAGTGDIEELTGVQARGITGAQKMITVSDSAPGSPESGDLWLDSNEASLYFRYEDSDSSQWVGLFGTGGAGGSGGGSGTSVAANPTGTDGDDLDRIQIGGTNYNIPSGGSGGLNTADVNTAIDNRVTQSFVNGLDIDADELDGQNGSYYLNYNNFTNRPTAFTNENVDDRVNSLLTAGDNITLQYNDSAGTLTINSTGGGGTLSEISIVAYSGTLAARDIAEVGSDSWQEILDVTSDINEGSFTVTTSNSTERIVIPEDGIYEIHVSILSNTTSDQDRTTVESRFSINDVAQDEIGRGYNRGELSSTAGETNISATNLTVLYDLSANDEIGVQVRSQLETSQFNIQDESFIHITKISGSGVVAGGGSGTSVMANPTGTSGTELSRLDIDGTNYNITPVSTSHIELNDFIQIRFGNINNAHFFYDGTNDDFELELETSVDDFKITSNGSDRFLFDRAAGNFTATGDITSFSDKRLKTNIKTFEGSLDIVKQLRGVSFKRTDTKKDGIGLIAQEVEKILPDVVIEDKNNMKSISYGNIVGVLIEAIKEQQEEIEEYKSKINSIDQKLNQLLNR